MTESDLPHRAPESAEQALEDLRVRVDTAQHLANMGDYDWHIPTDTNSWSDQLYRIYGFEPQSFNATYEKFLSMIHPDDRERVEQIHQEAYRTGGSYHMTERIVRPDGEVRYLLSNGEVITDASGTPVRMRGTCLDITDRVLAERAGEELAANLREAQVRRRQALEINDNLVQGLSAAALSLDAGDSAHAKANVQMVLTAARTMMNNLLRDPTGRALAPGDLVRTAASTLGPVSAPTSNPVNPVEPVDPVKPVEPVNRSIRRVRVVLADDHEQVRELLKAQLEEAGHEVVGTAADGEEAVAATERLHPDVLVLDLAMPRMDGLQALTRIRQSAPAVQVIVVSGFDAGQMAERALKAGARRYIEKGLSMNLANAVTEIALSA